MQLHMGEAMSTLLILHSECNSTTTGCIDPYALSCDSSHLSYSTQWLVIKACATEKELITSNLHAAFNLTLPYQVFVLQLLMLVMLDMTMHMQQ